MPTIRDTYEAHPAPGLLRFWVEWFAYAETYPKTDFPFWETGHGTTYRLRPSLTEEGRAKGLPETLNIDSHEQDQADIDRYYFTENSFAALMDAPNRDKVPEILKELFGKTMQIRFVKPQHAITLSHIEARGRFVVLDGSESGQATPAS